MDVRKDILVYLSLRSYSFQEQNYLHLLHINRGFVGFSHQDIVKVRNDNLSCGNILTYHIYFYMYQGNYKKTQEMDISNLKLKLMLIKRRCLSNLSVNTIACS